MVSIVSALERFYRMVVLKWLGNTNVLFSVKLVIIVYVCIQNLTSIYSEHPVHQLLGIWTTLLPNPFITNLLYLEPESRCSS